MANAWVLSVIVKSGIRFKTQVLVGIAIKFETTINSTQFQEQQISMISQKHLETIWEKSSFWLSQSKHISHNRECEPQPTQNTCKMAKFITI